MLPLPSARILPRLIAGLALAFSLACGLIQALAPTPAPPPTMAVYLPQAERPAALPEPTMTPAQEVDAPKAPAPAVFPETVEVTRLVPGPAVEVTRLVEGPPVEVEVTRLVEVVVTEVVLQTVIVERPVTLTPTSTAVVPILSQNELVYYDFEGRFPGTSRVVDRSGNGYHASLNGTVAAADGIGNGQAIAFNGDGYISTRGNPAAGLSTATFSLWFKTDHPEQNYKLASAAWWSGGPGSGWILGTQLSELWGDDNNSLFRSGQQDFQLGFPAGRWVHYVVVYDGVRIREYTDGDLVVDLAARPDGIGSGRDMAVGGWPQYTGFNFVGSIDEFRIYSRALSSAEILTLYNQR